MEGKTKKVAKATLVPNVGNLNIVLPAFMWTMDYYGFEMSAGTAASFLGAANLLLAGIPKIKNMFIK